MICSKVSSNGSFVAQYLTLNLEKQLRRILSATLAIPLADDLPILNSRKTCALIIWLIQVQRLPAPVLKPAADRIAYALRRGIDGELGREGKKGSANDGLKVHIIVISNFSRSLLELSLGYIRPLRASA